MTSSRVGRRVSGCVFLLRFPEKTSASHFLRIQNTLLIPGANSFHLTRSHTKTTTRRQQQRVSDGKTVQTVQISARPRPTLAHYTGPPPIRNKQITTAGIKWGEPVFEVIVEDASPCPQTCWILSVKEFTGNSKIIKSEASLNKAELKSAKEKSCVCVLGCSRCLHSLSKIRSSASSTPLLLQWANCSSSGLLPVRGIISSFRILSRPFYCYLQCYYCCYK